MLQMRGTLIIGLGALFFSCRTEETSSGSVPVRGDFMDTAAVVAIEDTSYSWDPSEAMANVAVTIADTGRTYEALHRMMHLLASVLPAEIDTMGRYYDPVRDSILVPMDDEDELYAGQYYPRRFEGNTLSIEYLDQYDTTAAPGTMALVTGLWARDQQADSALQLLRMHMPRAYKVDALVYQGCMH
jgi:hypothetical protein